MTAVTWAALAVAVLTAPVRSAPQATEARPPSSTSGRRLVPVSVASIGVACVLVLGPSRGAVAVVLVCPAAWFGLTRVVRRGAARERDVTLDPAVPLVLDLAAAALRAGRPLADALLAAAPAAPPAVAAEFGRVARLLRLGAEPARAWQPLARDGPLAPVAVAAVRSAGSGARIAVGFERLAAEFRDEATARAGARAQRVGVLAMAPLGACFLPSFVALGVVPVVVGLAGSVIAGEVPVG